MACISYANESHVERLLDQEDLNSSPNRTSFDLGYGERKFSDKNLEKYNYKAAELGFSVEFNPYSRVSTTSKISTTIGIKKDQISSENQIYDQRYYNLGLSQSINLNFEFTSFILQTFVGGSIAFNYYANVLDVKTEEKDLELFELASGQSYDYFTGIKFIFKKISPYLIFGINHFKPTEFEITNLKGNSNTASALSFTGANLKETKSSNTQYVMAGFSINF